MEDWEHKISMEGDAARRWKCMCAALPNGFLQCCLITDLITFKLGRKYSNFVLTSSIESNTKLVPRSRMVDPLTKPVLRKHG